MALLKSKEIAAFWSRVEVRDNFNCWNWRGQKNTKGYGRFKTTMAHRISYSLIKGKIPKNLIVRHICDNPNCCNPNHLLVGTAKDNARDAMERGRLAYGERNGKTKLTNEQVDYIRINPDHKTATRIAGEFGVSVSTVCYIRAGKRWKMAVGGRCRS